MEEKNITRLIERIVSIDCVPRQRLGQSTYEYALCYEGDILKD